MVKVRAKTKYLETKKRPTDKPIKQVHPEVAITTINSYNKEKILTELIFFPSMHGNQCSKTKESVFLPEKHTNVHRKENFYRMVPNI